MHQWSWYAYFEGEASRSVLQTERSEMRSIREEHCTCVEYSIEKIGMCWGQYNGTSNGFYLANYSFTYEGSSGDLTYDSHLRALTGIRP